MLISALVLIVMIGLRQEVGGDWFNYLDTLKRIEVRNFAAAIAVTDPGYAILNWIAAQAGWGIWFPNLMCGILFTWGLVTFCRQQPNPALALVVAIPFFVIGVGMGYTRQSAAVGLVMLGLTQYLRGSTNRMAVYLVLAPAFHVSAVIIIPIMGLVVARRGLFTGIIVFGLAAIVFWQVSATVSTSIEIYRQGQYGGGGAVPRVLMNIVPALILISLKRRFLATEEEMRVWIVFSLFALATGVMLFLFPSSAVADRVAIYIIPMQIFVLSRLPFALGKGERENILLVLLIILYSFLVEVVWLSYGAWAHAWLPYRNYLW